MIFSILLLLLLGALIIAGLGLLIYSIVAKRYWLAAILLLLPLGLIVLVIPALYFLVALPVPTTRSPTHEEQIDYPSQIVVSPQVETGRGNSRDIGFGEALEIVSTKYEYSPSKPLTADIYPSLATCARPLAFQLANDIRESNQFSPKTVFAIEFNKETQSSNNEAWQPSDNFIKNFQKELGDQFPNSTFVITAENSETDSPNQNLKPLNIQFSHTGSKDGEASDSIKASWSIDGKARSETLVNYVEKPWVTNPKEYMNENKAQKLVVGFTQRLARSRTEAVNFATQDATRQALSYGPNSTPRLGKPIDRFVQKISKPYGELWQAAILVPAVPNTSIANSSTQLEAFDSTQASSDRNSHSSLESSPRRLSYTNHKKTSLGPFLIILLAGSFVVAWVSNILTQGYYQQTINYTLVTALAVILGLMALALLFISA